MLCIVLFANLDMQAAAVGEEWEESIALVPYYHGSSVVGCWLYDETK